MTKEERTEHNKSQIRRCRREWYLNLGTSKEIIKRFKNSLICIECGEREYASLDFHHRNPIEKEFEISKRMGGNLERVLSECEKCDVLCANCHRKHHAKVGYK